MGDSLITLLILAGITVFLLLRLKNILGTKTGHEKPLEPVSAPSAVNVKPKPAPAEPEPIEEDDPLAEVWAKMRNVEADFSPRNFADGAKRAYEMLLMAYENGEKETLKTYLSPDVYQGFAAAIDQRAEEGLTVDARFVGVREARIVGARFDEEEKIAEIDMKFVGELITVVRDSEHRVVEGDPNEIRRESDQWTFGRQLGAKDPNWLLIATGE